MAPNKRQAIIWTNDDPVQRRIYASPGLIELTRISCWTSYLFTGETPHDVTVMTLPHHGSSDQLIQHCACPEEIVTLRHLRVGNPAAQRPARGCSTGSLCLEPECYWGKLKLRTGLLLITMLITMIQLRWFFAHPSAVVTLVVKYHVV